MVVGSSDVVPDPPTPSATTPVPGLSSASASAFASVSFLALAWAPAESRLVGPAAVLSPPADQRQSTFPAVATDGSDVVTVRVRPSRDSLAGPRSVPSATSSGRSLLTGRAVSSFSDTT